MPFDAGPRDPSPSPLPERLPPEKPTAEDALDLLLPIVVIVPLLCLYAWWAGSTILGALFALARH